MCRDPSRRPSIASGAPERETLCGYCYRPVSDHATDFDCIAWKMELPYGGVIFTLHPYVRAAYTWPG